jgi:hypothetical protein
MECNDAIARVFKEKGARNEWGELEVVYVRERTTMFNRTLIFKIRGHQRLLELFRETVTKAVQQYNAPF